MKRVLVLLPVFSLCAFAQPRPAASPAQAAVTAAYGQLEKSIRESDPELWLRLHDRETQAQMNGAGMDGMREAAKRRGPNPSVRYQPLVVRVVGNDAVVIGSITQPKEAVQYHSVRYVNEGGEWKISLEGLSENPIDPRSAFALVPPAGGAFSRAGSPWQTVPYANLNTARFKPEQLPWKMQATQDESFLYVRFEAAAPVPAPGLEVQRSDRPIEGPQTVKIVAASSPVVEFQLGQVVQTRATYDEAAKKYDNRFYVQYSLNVREATRGVQTGNVIFDTSTGDRPGLVTAQDRYLEARIPLQALGLDPARRTQISLEEYNSLPKILPYRVTAQP